MAFNRRMPSSWSCLDGNPGIADSAVRTSRRARSTIFADNSLFSANGSTRPSSRWSSRKASSTGPGVRLFGGDFALGQSGFGGRVPLDQVIVCRRDAHQVLPFAVHERDARMCSLQARFLCG